MKTLLLAIAAAMLAVAPGLAQEIDKEKPGSTEPAKPAPADPKDDKKDDADKEGDKEAMGFDRLTPYRNKGNTWTHKVTSKLGESTYTSYTKYEVLEVGEKEATVKMTSMNSDKKELSSSEYKEPLGAKDDNAADMQNPQAKKTEEKIKVTAGEFDCVKIELKNDTYTTTTWFDKNTGLVVKISSKSDTRESTTELIEHKVS